MSPPSVWAFGRWPSCSGRNSLLSALSHCPVLCARAGSPVCFIPPLQLWGLGVLPDALPWPEAGGNRGSCPRLSGAELGHWGHWDTPVLSFPEADAPRSGSSVHKLISGHLPAAFPTHANPVGWTHCRVLPTAPRDRAAASARLCLSPASRHSRLRCICGKALWSAVTCAFPQLSLTADSLSLLFFGDVVFTCGYPVRDPDGSLSH